MARATPGADRQPVIARMRRWVQVDFLMPTREEFEAVKAMGERLEIVSAERIRDELKLSSIQMGWTLAAFAWARGEALPADMAQPVYLRDKVATPKAPQ